jgi:hypothetical protein
MKTKRIIATGSIVLVVVAGLGIIGHLGGCRPHPFAGEGFCPRFSDRGSTPKFMGMDIADFILKRFDRHVEELKLEDDQQVRYEELRAQFRTNLLAGFEKRQGVIHELRGEMGGENPDIHKAVGFINSGIREFSVLMEKNLDLLVAFYDILDENQRTMVIERIRDRMNCE